MGKCVIIVEQDPQKFLDIFWEQVDKKNTIFIGNPNWKSSEWDSLKEILNPDSVLGNSAPKIQWEGKKQDFSENRIFISTGGTTGKIRFVEHTLETLSCPTQSILNFFKIKRINSFCILPLHHISGLIQALRAKTSEGNLTLGNWKEIENGHLPKRDFNGYFLSLVPTQLQRLLQKVEAIEWLKQFVAIFLGGAPASESLLEQARELKLNIAPSYGMSETAAMVAVMHPKDFLSGNAGVGQMLEHVKINFSEDRRIWIKATSLFKGYFPEKKYEIENGYFCTQDTGGLNKDGYLENISRSDRIIITGGKKLNPTEIEKLLNEIEFINESYVYSEDHVEWGQRICAAYSTNNKQNISADTLKNHLRDKIEAYKIPKQFFHLEHFPTNEKGKLNIKKLKEFIKQ